MSSSSESVPPPGETLAPEGWRASLWLLLLLIPPVILFAPHLLGRQILLSGDTFYYFYPYRYTLWQGLQQGVLPVWESSALSGNPFCANPQANCYYPLSLLYLLPDFFRAYQASVFVHLTLGGMGVALWLARRGHSRAAALLAGGLWQVGGTTLSMVNRLDKLESLTWWGFALFYLEMILQQRRQGSRVSPGAIVGLSVSLSLQLLAGGLELVLMTGVSLGMVWGLSLPLWSWTAWRQRWSALPALLLVGVLALGLTAVQWVPLLELMGLSNRAQGLPLQKALELSMAPGDLWGFLAPRLFFEPDRMTFLQAAGTSPAPRYYYGLYLGLVPLLLVLCGVGRGLQARETRRDTLLSLLLLALGITMALGSYNPLYSMAYKLVPGISAIRFPEKFLAFTGMAMLPLLARGLDELLQDRRLWRLTFGLVTAGMLLFFGAGLAVLKLWALVLSLTSPGQTVSLEGRLWPGLGVLPPEAWLQWLRHIQPSLSLSLVVAWAVLGLLGLVVGKRALSERFSQLMLGISAVLLIGEVGVFNQGLNLSVDRSFLEQAPALARTLQTQLRGARVHILPLYTGQSLDDMQPEDTAVDSYARLRELLYPSLGQIYDIPYGDGPRALRLREQGRAFAPLVGASLDQQLQGLQQLGVPALVVKGRANVEALSALARQRPGLTRVSAAGELELWRVPDVAPRAWLKPDALAAVPGSGKTSLGESTPILIWSPTAGHILGYQSRDGGVGLEISAAGEGAAGWVVLPQAWYPGWEARLDGLPVTCQRVNGYQLGVRVTAGWHSLELQFCPRHQSLTSGVSLLTACVLAGLMGMRRRWVTASAQRSAAGVVRGHSA